MTEALDPITTTPTPPDIFGGKPIEAAVEVLSEAQQRVVDAVAANPYIAHVAHAITFDSIPGHEINFEKTGNGNRTKMTQNDWFGIMLGHANTLDLLEDIEDSRELARHGVRKALNHAKAAKREYLAAAEADKDKEQRLDNEQLG